MLKVEQIEEHEWEFVYPPKYRELMNKFGEGVELWDDPEMKQWLIRNRGKGKGSESSLR